MPKVVSSMNQRKVIKRRFPWKQMWMSDASRNWDRRIEGFREHIANDGSLKRVSGRDAACRSSLVHRDYDKD